MTATTITSQGGFNNATGVSGNAKTGGLDPPLSSFAVRRAKHGHLCIDRRFQRCGVEDDPCEDDP